MDIVPYLMGVKKGAESVPEVIRINGFVVDDNTLRITYAVGVDLSVYNRIQVVMTSFPGNASQNMRDSDILCAYYKDGKAEFLKWNHSKISNTSVEPTITASRIDLPAIDGYTWITASGHKYMCVCWAE